MAEHEWKWVKGYPEHTSVPYWRASGGLWTLRACWYKGYWCASASCAEDIQGRPQLKSPQTRHRSAQAARRAAEEAVPCLLLGMYMLAVREMRLRGVEIPDGE